MSNAIAFAGFLGALRQKGRAIPISAAEALLLIAAGIDHVADLHAAMRDTEGNALPAATMSRLVSLLRGRARYDQGTWIESPYGLIEVRPHPHRRGLQLRLSAAGLQLIYSHFGQNFCTIPLVIEPSTRDEKNQ